MTAEADNKFACLACGRRYVWRAELAGKRVKCKCGQQVAVPARVAGAAMPVAAASTPSTGRATLAYASGAPTREEKRFSLDNLIDKKRDIYLPTIVLCIGVIALLAWAVTEAEAGSIGVAIFGTVILVKTLIKTVILIGLAIVIAPMAGLGFGGLWTTVLKLAAIIVFADALLLWFETLLEHLNAVPTGRRSNIYVGVMKTCLTGTFIAIQLRFMFDFDSEETGWLAIPMAILNRLLDFVLWIGLLVMVEAMLAPAAPPAPAPAPAAAPAPPPPPPAQAEAAELDLLIRKQANRNELTEGRDWSAQGMSNREKPTKQLIERLYTAGATKVWVEKISLTPMLFAELPADPPARARVVAVAREFSPTIADVGQRYLPVQPPALTRR